MERILFYEGKWYMFSNFSSFAIYWRGEDWMTTEHAYQAAKFEHSLELWHAVRRARSAHDAKKLARKHAESVRKDWQQVKLSVMEEIVRAKFEQHPLIRERLIESGTTLLVEDSPKDSFWGRGPDWNGENHLGKLWMKLREEILRRP